MEKGSKYIYLDNTENGLSVQYYFVFSLVGPCAEGRSAIESISDFSYTPAWMFHALEGAPYA